MTFAQALDALERLLAEATPSSPNRWTYTERGRWRRRPPRHRESRPTCPPELHNLAPLLIEVARLCPKPPGFRTDTRKYVEALDALSRAVEEAGLK